MTVSQLREILAEIREDIPIIVTDYNGKDISPFGVLVQKGKDGNVVAEIYGIGGCR